MNTGAPATAVTAPTGSSAGETTVRANVSESTSMIAPPNAAAGMSARWSLPTSIRPKCGTSNPRYPIAPLTETAKPVSTEAIR